MHVSSRSAAYSVRGVIDLASERFRVRAHVRTAPYTHFSGWLDVIGVEGQSYELVHADERLTNLDVAGCAVDPHAPIGSLGGAASVQESVALAGIATRLLRDTPRKVAERQHRRTYRAVVDPAKARRSVSSLGDEWVTVDPPRLARHLGPIELTLASDGLIHRLSMQLRRFPPPSRGPGIRREDRRERVSLAVSLADFGRPLHLRRPSCVAME